MADVQVKNIFQTSRVSGHHELVLWLLQPIRRILGMDLADQRTIFVDFTWNEPSHISLQIISGQESLFAFAIAD